MLGFIESRHGTPGLSGGNEHTASTAAQFERFSGLPAEIDIEVYVAPRIVQRNVVVQFWKLRMSAVAGFRGHSSLWPLQRPFNAGNRRFPVTSETCSLWTKIRRSSPIELRRQSTIDGIVGPHRTPTSGTISRDIRVSVIRSLEPIQHMPPQGVSFRQEGMIEVIGRIARHAQFFHHLA